MSQNKGLSRQWFEKIASPEAIAEFDSGRLTIAVTPRCEHDWSGPEIKFPNGASVSCAKCGALAIDDDAKG